VADDSHMPDTLKTWNELVVFLQELDPETVDVEVDLDPLDEIIPELDGPVEECDGPCLHPEHF